MFEGEGPAARAVGPGDGGGRGGEDVGRLVADRVGGDLQPCPVGAADPCLEISGIGDDDAARCRVVGIGFIKACGARTERAVEHDLARAPLDPVVAAPLAVDQLDLRLPILEWQIMTEAQPYLALRAQTEIGRASCRERVCQYV